MQPINHITWIPVTELHANNYNPNHVQPQELQLLQHSIKRHGWLHPILINKDKTIIDGYHRYTIAKQHPQLTHDGKIPCIVLNLTPAEQILTTIRINRAKGTHTVYKMHTAVTKLYKKYNLSIETICKELGANKEEITLLLLEDVYEKLDITDNTQYNQAWTPTR